MDVYLYSININTTSILSIIVFFPNVNLRDMEKSIQFSLLQVKFFIIKKVVVEI
jgi:hypothetical protein